MLSALCVVSSEASSSGWFAITTPLVFCARPDTTEPSRLVTRRSLMVMGTKADCVETAVKQSEPSDALPTTRLVGLACKLTSHWQPGPGVTLALVNRVPVLRVGAAKLPHVACTLKLIVSTGDPEITCSGRQATVCVRTTADPGASWKHPLSERRVTA